MGIYMHSESPEGGSVGVVKNLGYLTHITIKSNIDTVYNFLENDIIKIETLTPNELYNKVKLFINGNWVVYVRIRWKCIIS